MRGHRAPQLELLPQSTAASVTYHRFLLAGAWIDYSIKRSARRRGITLTVGETGLRVGASIRASQRRVETVLLHHERWIVRKLAEWSARQPPRMEWRDNAAIMLTGQPLKLSLNAECIAIRQADGKLQVPLSDADCMERRVTAWLRDAASSVFDERVAYYAPILGVQMPLIHLSSASTRWGSCHPDGRIYLNWRLVQMPVALIDYVVVHELAHLHESNHSPRFWRHVAAVLPDHKVRRKTLRTEGVRYLML